MRVSSLVMMAFLLMSLVYGAASSSSPDKIGVAEMLIGLCLVVIAGLHRVAQLVDIGRGDPLPYGWGVPLYVRVAALYLFLVPTIYGLLIVRNDPGDFVRDFIPFVYMLIPLLFIGRYRMDPQRWLLVVIAGLCIVGVGFSIRFFQGADASLLDIGSRLIFSDNRDNTMQDSASLFFLSFSSCLGLWLLLSGRRLLGCVVLAVAVLPWAVMLASVMRAPVVITTLAMALTFARWLSMNGKRGKFGLVFLLFILASGLVLAQPLIDSLGKAIDLLLMKQQEYGLNGRDMEASAVVDNIDTIAVLLFGEGWGGLIANPIGGGAHWRFVHNMEFYFLFKVGLCGVVAVVAFFYWLARMVLKISFRNDLLFLVIVSMLCPLAVAMMLEATYKSLSFGLVLSLLPLMVMVSDQDKLNRIYVGPRGGR